MEFVTIFASVIVIHRCSRSAETLFSGPDRHDPGATQRRGAPSPLRLAPPPPRPGGGPGNEERKTGASACTIAFAGTERVRRGYEKTQAPREATPVPKVVPTGIEPIS